MKKWLVFLVLVTTMAWLPSQARAAEPQAPSASLISITLDDVDLVDVVRMFTRITGMNLQFEPGVFRDAKRVSLNLKDEPWQPALQSILASRGLVLLKEPDGHKTYSIVKADRPDMAVRIQYASAAVSLADAVLADLKTNDIDTAKARLEAFAAANRETVKSFEESKSKQKQEK